MKIEKLEYYSSSNDGYTFERHPNIGDITDKINEIIDKLNERDDVEIVRCKDCIHSNGTLKYCSIDHWVNKDESSFCSYGERKKDELV